MHRSNKHTILTILACLFFVISIFAYTVTYRISHVTAIDSTKLHQAKDKYMNTESYH